MNFDNNGMKYYLEKDNTQFIVYVDAGQGKYPSFGISKERTFFNNLIVESNGKGLYRRPSTKVTHTTKLITELLHGKIRTLDLNEYFKKVEIVNTPNWSCHNLICDNYGNVWIVEPGRGTLYSPKEESDYVIMTNESIIDGREKGIYTCKRYNRIAERLSLKTITIPEAIDILKTVSQGNGEWRTELSLVYSKEEKAIYYYSNDSCNVEKHALDI
jgi:hypothetical protein